MTAMPQRRIRMPRHIGGPKLRHDVASGTFAGRRAFRARGRLEPRLRDFVQHSRAWADGFKRGAWRAAEYVRRGLRR